MNYTKRYKLQTTNTKIRIYVHVSQQKDIHSRIMVGYRTLALVRKGFKKSFRNLPTAIATMGGGWLGVGDGSKIL